MSPDGATLLDEGKLVVDGNGGPYQTIEGPKLYKRNNYYYIIAPGGGVSRGYQLVFRSRDIYGPYESRIVMDQGSSSVNGPHQGTGWKRKPARTGSSISRNICPMAGSCTCSLLNGSMTGRSWAKILPGMARDNRCLRIASPMSAEHIQLRFRKPATSSMARNWDFNGNGWRITETIGFP